MNGEDAARAALAGSAAMRWVTVGPGRPESPEALRAWGEERGFWKPGRDPVPGLADSRGADVLHALLYLSRTDRPGRPGTMPCVGLVELGRLARRAGKAARKGGSHGRSVV